ncbi:RDD family protein [Methylobacterium sp. WL103]|uniref:RDD family protein n=1 Tax=unclassified Methylobacterium TaxID=2615210 RepID=UPI0011C85BBB|nr:MULTISPECIES: RDD family protein [unclassified Methylobacterium]TXM69330.1 RDD family protein [Methylobacterium sp. WL12]TXN03344.1 RDD family protein [Methylobacterium sp. WL103]
MLNPRPEYARPFDAPGYLPPVAMPAVRASLGGRTVAYMLDILFILGFTALLSVAIAFVGVVTFGLGWALFAILPASGVIYSAITVGGSRQSTLGMRMMGLRVVAPESGRPVDILTAAVHALLFYVAVSTFLLWFLDLAFGLVRADRRLGHDVLLGLAVVRAG